MGIGIFKRKFREAFEIGAPPPYQSHVNKLTKLSHPAFQRHEIFVWDKVHLWQASHHASEHGHRDAYLGDGKLTAVRVSYSRHSGLTTYTYHLEFDPELSLQKFILKWEITEATYTKMQSEDDGQSYLWCHALSTRNGMDGHCIAVSRVDARYVDENNAYANYFSIDRPERARLDLFLSGAKQNIVEPGEE